MTFPSDAAVSDRASAVPTGAALAPLRARYADWLGLDAAAVVDARQERPDEIRALQLLLRLERPIGGRSSRDGIVPWRRPPPSAPHCVWTRAASPAGSGTTPWPTTAPGGPVLRVWVPVEPPMTAGKQMAQTGHAGMIAAALLAGDDPAALLAWTAAGCAVRVERRASADWTDLLARIGDPEKAWQDEGLLAVRDAGFTEIAPGTVTVIACTAGLKPVDPRGGERAHGDEPGGDSDDHPPLKAAGVSPRRSRAVKVGRVAVPGFSWATRVVGVRLWRRSDPVGSRSPRRPCGPAGGYLARSGAVDTDRDAPVSFPRLAARTQRFTLGEPRSITVTPDGSRVLFIRTASGTDRAGALWEFDVDSGNERVLADPAALLDGGEELSAAERARRERARETGAGVVSYTVDDAGRNAAFALSGGVWVCDLVTGRVDELPRVDGVGAAIDPRIDPTGHQVAYTADGALRLVGMDGTGDRALVESDGPGVVWGQAEFVAAEEMDRFRGFWWAPDGSGLLVERYDETPVPVWHLADPADPGAAPVAHRYPVAGSDDALVQLWHLTVDGDRWQVPWDEVTFPYLTRVSWTGRGDPVVQVMSRDQRTAAVIRVDTAARTTITVAEISDPVWVELVSGVPACAADGRLLTTVDDVDSDTRRLAVDGVPFSPAGLQIREVLDVDDDGVLVRASTEDPTVVRLLLVRWDGRVTEMSTGAGVHGGARAGGTTVVASARMDTDGVEVAVSRDDERRGTLARQGISPPVKPQVELLRSGPHDVATAVLFPSGHTSGTGRLPVLMAPYGGPHGQLVQQHRRGFLQAQYLADQGFCVVVADGRGTPGRGPHWEKAVRDEFASVTLQDQVDALDGVAARYPGDVDTDRVGILGWSYGGYLSALAVLERPDVFRAAVAGAPVTDWRLYDTFYTERYLGHPDEQPDVYLRNSLLDTASVPFVPTAEVPEPPQLLILHGMVDDNVVVAHTLRLSSALLAAGRPHAVLPLTGVTHMTPQEVVAENLLFLQVDFLRRALGAVSAG